MKRANTLAILASLIFLYPASAGEPPVHVFILAGQSNMEGQGVVEMDDPRLYNGGKGNLVWSMEHSASKDRMRHLRDVDGEWVVRDDVAISFKARDEVRKGPLTIGYTGYGGASHIGPELQFGHVAGDFFDEPVLLIKTAWGGKSLQVDFRPPGSGGETGAYYKKMVAEVRDALAELGDREHHLAGFVWMQGWNDMVSKEATAEYAANLENLARDIRLEFKSPRLPIVIGELGNGGPAPEGGGMRAFRDVQPRGAERIARARFVETQAFARPKELSPNAGHGHRAIRATVTTTPVTGSARRTRSRAAIRRGWQTPPGRLIWCIRTKNSWRICCPIWNVISRSGAPGIGCPMPACSGRSGTTTEWNSTSPAVRRKTSFPARRATGPVLTARPRIPQGPRLLPRPLRRAAREGDRWQD